MVQKDNLDAHTRTILARYRGSGPVEFVPVSPDVLIDRYLAKVANPREFSGKTILELGAGCSHYVPVFLNAGCARYYANDLVAERLEAIRVQDSRFVAVPGDFRYIELPEPVDIVFANLTMMFLIPMLDELILKIFSVLRSGGIFLGMDPNYLCLLSLLRLAKDRTNNPSRVFNPHHYARAFRRAGFDVQSLVPFTGPVPALTGSWVLGTNFWIRAYKP